MVYVREEIETPVSITVQAGAPYPDGRKVQFEFMSLGVWANGSTQNEEGTTKGGACAVKWVPPSLDSREEKRTVVCTATVQGDFTIPAQELAFTVWPRTITVIAKDATGDPVRHATFTMTANGRPHAGVTDDRGEAKNVEVPDAGPLAIEWDAPWARRGEWEIDGRTWRATLVPLFTAKLRWPPSGAHKQWVNLPSNADEKSEGNDITVEVELDPPDASGKVHVLCELGDRNSERNHPKPAIHAPAVALPPRKHKLTLDVAANGVASFRAELGKAGGDTLTIKVSTSPEVFQGLRDQDKVTVTNWRKIFYQLTTPAFEGFPDEIPAGVWGGVEEQLRQVNVVLEKFADKRLTKEELVAIHPGIVVTGDRLDEARKDRDAFVANLRDDGIVSGFGRLLEPGKGTRACQIILCDGFFKPDVATTRVKRVTDVDDVANAEAGIEFDSGHLFRTTLRDGSPSLTVKWRLAALERCPADHATVSASEYADALLAGRWINMLEEWVKWDTAKNRAITLELPADHPGSPRGLIGPQADATWPIEIQYEAALAEPLGILGGNFGSLTFLELNSENPPAPKGLASLFLHELGHAMSLTVVPPERARGASRGWQGITYTPAEEPRKRGRYEEAIATLHCKDSPPGLAPHKYSYIGRGHFGPHCGFGTQNADGGLPDTYVDEADGGSINGPGTCIMFGQPEAHDDALAPTGYCAECVRFLKAEALESISKIWANFDDVMKWMNR